MHPDKASLTPEHQVLLAKHYKFYRALDEGRHSPTTNAQWHFLAVCRGKAKPKTDHEYAYLRMKFLQAKIRKNSPLVRLERNQIAAGPSDPKDSFCPRCARYGIKALMVWRTYRKAERSGQFLGCSRFPKCRYIEH